MLSDGAAEIKRRKICLGKTQIATDAGKRLIKRKTGACVNVAEMTCVKNAPAYSTKTVSVESAQRCGKQKGEAALSLNCFYVTVAKSCR